ncbi:chaperone NapD [Lysobacter cavernae]|uniref:Chaperone NapD n=1 Tax=Lysobacter cavernae TaxID=1685901 RepID=A0ABV7RQ66_9GAMM
MTDEVHISSLLVQHRHEAGIALAALIAAHPELDLAVQAPCQCVVLCETDDQYALMQRIDALQAVPGVLSVSLVYHHAEPRVDLDEPMLDEPMPGEPMPHDLATSGAGT